MLAFLGGTGPEGKGLALRLALAGESIVVGSRDGERASTAAVELTDMAKGHASIKGTDNLNAAKEADVIFLTVPYDAQRALLEQLKHIIDGKIVINVIAPMIFQRGVGASAVEVSAGSAAQESQEILPNSVIVSAFQNVSAEELLDQSVDMEGDVIICSDNEEAKVLAFDLTNKIPSLRPIDGGGLANSKYVEQITPLLVNINRIYKIHSGIHVVGI